MIIRMPRAGLAALACCLLAAWPASHAAAAAIGDEPAGNQPAGNQVAGDQAGGDQAGGDQTVAAVPSDRTAAAVREASAATFRPAPVPDETMVVPGAAPSADEDGPSLHPEFIGVGEKDDGGAMATASSEYDHSARMKPAGGMGLTIPMQ